MRTEVIIAVRGELTANMERTLKTLGDVPVKIVMDGMEGGNVKSPYLPVALRPWGDSRGPGAARHAGILASDADLIVLCDGHMAFPPGAVAAIQKYHERMKNALTCCRMQSLAQDGTPLPDKPEGGAWLALKTSEILDQQWALSAKWLVPARTRGTIPAVMGACYAFRREWYDRIGQPLRILRAWGGDEEILSVATHLMGGRVQLLPLLVGHIFAAAHTGRDETADQAAHRHGNRRSVIEAIPMPDAERADLLAWWRGSKQIIRELPEPPQAAFELREVLARGKRTWAQLREDGIVREPTPAEQERFLGYGQRVAQTDAQRSVRTPVLRQPSVPVPAPVRHAVRRPSQPNAIRHKEWGAYDAARRPK